MKKAWNEVKVDYYIDGKYQTMMVKKSEELKTIVDLLAKGALVWSEDEEDDEDY